MKKQKKELLIFSPFLSYNAINSDNLIPLIAETIARGVRIIVVTDRYLDQKADRAIKDHSQQARDLLLRHGVTLLLANGIHNKTILIDDSVLIEGSFNWLSATRDKNSPYHRDEASIVITDGSSIQASTLDLRNKVQRYQKDNLAKTS